MTTNGSAPPNTSDPTTEPLRTLTPAALATVAALLSGHTDPLLAGPAAAMAEALRAATRAGSGIKALIPSAPLDSTRALVTVPLLAACAALLDGHTDPLLAGPATAMATVLTDNAATRTART